MTRAALNAIGVFAGDAGCGAAWNGGLNRDIRNRYWTRPCKFSRRYTFFSLYLLPAYEHSTRESRYVVVSRAFLPPSIHLDRPGHR